MKIAAWNVNSLKVRLPQLLTWLSSESPDIVCLQEIKLENSVFPVAQLRDAGYHAVFNGQKTYNGVAILARHPIEAVTLDNPLFPDPQKRLISASILGLRIISAYVPNGQALDSEKYPYKLNWLQGLQAWITDEIRTHPALVIAGDFNIAPEDQDVYDPAAWKDQVLCSAPERAAFRELQALGLHDSFRLFEQAEKSYSWWDYRQLGFQKNRGLRIDHILLSTPLKSHCTAAGITRDMRKQERPSDHAPVWVSLANPYAGAS